MSLCASCALVLLYSLYGTKAFWPVRVRPQPHWVQGNTARPLDISIYEPYSCDTLVSRRLWPSALGRGSVHFGAAACLCTRCWTIEFVSFRCCRLVVLTLSTSFRSTACLKQLACGFLRFLDSLRSIRISWSGYDPHFRLFDLWPASLFAF